MQDLGRPGYETSGVSPAARWIGMRCAMANLLVGNDEGAAALEICLSGPVLKFQWKQWSPSVGRTGKSSGCGGRNRGFFQTNRRCPRLPRGVRRDAWCPGVGKTATDLRAGFGGFPGARCKRVTGWISEKLDPHPVVAVGTSDGGSRFTEIELRFIPGVQDDWFSDDAMQRFRKRSINSRQIRPDGRAAAGRS